MDIKRVGSQPSGKGPTDWFTGVVRIDPLFQTEAPARTAGASVTFEPGSRTAWHTHPLVPDPDRDCRLRLGAARGRYRGRDPAR
jgi:quercetin dioxygenase-like cupin family protein